LLVAALVVAAERCSPARAAAAVASLAGRQPILERGALHLLAAVRKLRAAVSAVLSRVASMSRLAARKQVQGSRHSVATPLPVSAQAAAVAVAVGSGAAVAVASLARAALGTHHRARKAVQVVPVMSLELLRMSAM
jgi:hypothetical protein